MRKDSKNEIVCPTINCCASNHLNDDEQNNIEQTKNKRQKYAKIKQ